MLAASVAGCWPVYSKPCSVQIADGLNIYTVVVPRAARNLTPTRLSD
jgi:hypothetical protein